MFHIYTCIKSTSTIFTIFTFFIYLSPLISALPLAWPVLYSCPSLFRCLFIVQWDFCLGILPISILRLSEYNSRPLYFLTLFPLCSLQQLNAVFKKYFFSGARKGHVNRSILMRYKLIEKKVLLYLGIKKVLCDVSRWKITQDE
jgi:hypothetical protein